MTCGAVGMHRVRPTAVKGARAKKIAGALNASGATREQWSAALRACAQDRHWQGDNDRGWRGTLDSFLALKHRERWLDAGEIGEDTEDPRGVPPRVNGQRMTWDAIYEMTSRDTGKPIDQVKEEFGHAV